MLSRFDCVSWLDPCESVQIRGSVLFFVQLSNPDVAVAYGIAVILQLER
jgi:hypothetical protein